MPSSSSFQRNRFWRLPGGRAGNRSTHQGRITRIEGTSAALKSSSRSTGLPTPSSESWPILCTGPTSKPTYTLSRRPRDSRRSPTGSISLARMITRSCGSNSPCTTRCTPGAVARVDEGDGMERKDHESKEGGGATDVPLWRFLLYFLYLGALGFGGPIALAGYMQRDLVERRRWTSEEDYQVGLALAQLAPGPLAAQLAIYLG